MARGATGSIPTHSAVSDREALLELHRQDRRAHLQGDADLLIADMADFVWESSRGGLNRISREEIGHRFAAYFATVRYSLWDDLQPPHVAVAPGGDAAWMAVDIEARLTAEDDAGAEQEVSFESSWISVYEKHNDRWLLAGIASSVVERANS
jgi:hypothetical protein